MKMRTREETTLRPERRLRLVDYSLPLPGQQTLQNNSPCVFGAPKHKRSNQKYIYYIFLQPPRPSCFHNLWLTVNRHAAPYISSDTCRGWGGTVGCTSLCSSPQRPRPWHFAPINARRIMALQRCLHVLP